MGDPAGAVGDPDRSAIVREEPILYFSWLQSGDFTRMINLGFNVTYTAIAADLNLDNLLNFTALIIFATPSGKITDYADDIEAFVDGGGSLFIHQPNKIGLVDYAPTGFEIEITNSFWCPFGAEATIIDHSHPLTKGFDDTDLGGAFDSVGNLGKSYSVLSEDICRDPHMAVGTLGAGKVLFDVSGFAETAIVPASDAFVANLLDWLCGGTVGTEEVSWSELKATYR